MRCMRCRSLLRPAIVALVVTLVHAVAWAQDKEPAANPREALLKRLEETSRKLLNVPRNDGMFLNIVAQTRGAKRALEVGSSNGYSTIWIGAALEQTGGQLWTIEINAERAKQCRENVVEAGLEKIVTAIHGDAFKVIPDLAGNFDFVFFDIGGLDEKALPLVLPKLDRGGVILAHDTTLLAKQMQGYLEAIGKHPDFDTVTLTTPGGFGFAFSVRKQK